MRFNSGWVKFHRSFWSSSAYKDPETALIFLWLLSHANFTKSRVVFGGKVLTLEPGQLITGRREIDKSLCLSEQKVRSRLAWLQAMGTISLNSTHYGTVITLCKWNDYQNEDATAQPTSNQPPTNLQPTSNQPLTNDQPLSKKVKKARKKETLPMPEPGDEALAILWHQWAKLTLPNLAMTPKWADTIRQMRTIDGFTIEQLGQALDFVKTDDFWKPNALSVLGLRKPCKDGLTKIQHIVKKLQPAKKSYFETEKFL